VTLLLDGGIVVRGLAISERKVQIDPDPRAQAWKGMRALVDGVAHRIVGYRTKFDARGDDGPQAFTLLHVVPWSEDASEPAP
jgi:hypothetical protein